MVRSTPSAAAAAARLPLAVSSAEVIFEVAARSVNFGRFAIDVCEQSRKAGGFANDYRLFQFCPSRGAVISGLGDIGGEPERGGFGAISTSLLRLYQDFLGYLLSGVKPSAAEGRLDPWVRPA